MKDILLAALMAIFLLYHFYRIITAKACPLPYQDIPELPESLPTVSFLVPSWNDKKHLEPFIRSFNTLSYPHKELILCVGGCDGSFEYAQQFSSPVITVLRQDPGEGKQRALRKSYPLSHGEIIYLTDVDCRLTDNVVYHMVSTVLNNDCTVTGPSDPLHGQRRNPLIQVQWAVDRVTEPSTCTTTGGILGRNAVVPKSLLDAVGAFDQDVPSGTDYFLAKTLLRHNCPILFVPYARITSEYPETLGLYIRKQSRWIRNVLVLGMKFHEKQEVSSSLMTMAIPVVTVLSMIAASITIVVNSHWSLAVTFVVFVLILHPVLARLRYLCLAGIPVTITGVGLHFLGTSMASLRATEQIMRKSWVW